MTSTSSSEIRRAARALVEARHASFRSRHPLAESLRRVQAALAAPARTGLSRGLAGEASGERVVLRERTSGMPHARFEGAWTEDAEGVALSGSFLPSSRAQRFLARASMVLTALVLASAGSWIVSDEAAVRYLVPLFTILAILAFPFAVVALNSQREAEEARIARALRHLLADEDERYPPAQRWADEE